MSEVYLLSKIVTLEHHEDHGQVEEVLGVFTSTVKAWEYAKKEAGEYITGRMDFSELNSDGTGECRALDSLAYSVWRYELDPLAPPSPRR